MSFDSLTSYIPVSNEPSAQRNNHPCREIFLYSFFLSLNIVRIFIFPSYEYLEDTCNIVPWMALTFSIINYITFASLFIYLMVMKIKYPRQELEPTTNFGIGVFIYYALLGSYLVYEVWSENCLDIKLFFLHIEIFTYFIIICFGTFLVIIFGIGKFCILICDWFDKCLI